LWQNELEGKDACGNRELKEFIKGGVSLESVKKAESKCRNCIPAVSKS
jgi:hypothetical protein